MRTAMGMGAALSLGVLALTAVSCTVQLHGDTGSGHKGEISFHLGDADEKVQALEDHTLTQGKAGSLILDTKNGSIQVDGSDGDQIRMHVEEEVHATTRTAAQDFLKQIKIEQRQEGDHWIVKATWPDHPPKDVHGVSVSFRVHAPRTMRLEASTGDGSIAATGLRETSLHTGDGSIEAHTIAGRVDTDTGDGSITIDGSAGPVQAHTGDGAITIHGAQSLHRIDTGNGSITVEMARDAVEVGSMELTTGDGSITLGLPENVSAKLEADTGDGSIDIEPAGSARFNEERTHMNAVLGDGKNTIHLHTGDGSITVHRAR